MVTIDASVLVAAGARDDPAHSASLAFLQAVIDAGRAIHQPTLSLVEVAAAIARRTNDDALAREAGLRLLQLPRLVVHPLDLELAAEAAALAGQLRLRGADAVYAATARRGGVVLVTLDDQVRTRTAPIVASMTPAEWLASSA